jgi:hypothetical protein
MKARHPNLDWMRKVLADLERDRLDPQIAVLLGDAAALCSDPEPKGTVEEIEMPEPARKQ